MNWSLAFEPLISWPLLGLVLTPLLLLALVGLWFRQRGAVFRLAGLLALAAALLNPVFLDEEREALKSVVAVVVDRSQSQDIGERTKQTDEALAGLSSALAASSSSMSALSRPASRKPPRSAPKRGFSARLKALSATCHLRASAAPS